MFSFLKEAYGSKFLGTNLTYSRYLNLYDGTLDFIWFEWDIEKCKYFCLSTGSIYKSVIILHFDKWTLKLVKRTQVLLEIYIILMLA